MDRNSTIIGLDQDLLVVFALAWRANGTALTRTVATIISFSAAFRVLCNIVLCVAIFRLKQLRTSKEYLLVGYMSFYDMLDGCWHFCAVSLDYGIQTRLQCLFTLRHLIWFMFGGQSSTSMLIMVSIDRLLSIAFPFWYWKQGPRLAHILGGVAFLYAFCFACYLITIPISRPDELVPYCYTTHTFAEGFDHDGVLRRVNLIASVLLYVLVVALYSYRRHKSLTQIGRFQGNHAKGILWKQFRESQRAMTITLGISAVITLTLNVVPISFWHWLRHAYPSLQQIGWLCFAMVDWSSMANLFLISHRHREVKKALTALVTFKNLPSDIRQW